MVEWIVRFVDKPDTGRVTRLDLNDNITTYVHPEEFTLGVGEKEVVSVGSMLTEGETVTATRRTNREIVIPLSVIGGSPTLGTFLNALTRELDRTRGYLEFKPSDHTGESVFFTILPGSDFDEVALDPEDFPDEKGVTVTLVAEPTAVGLEQSGSTTTGPDPAGSNKPFVALPVVKGDVPSPLTVKVGPASTDATGPVMVSVCSGPPVLTVPYFVQAEALTMGTGASTPGTDAAMSGTGSSYARVGFGTNNLTTLRLSGDVVSVPPGKWKVWARLRNTIANDTFELRLDVGTATSSTTGKVRAFKPAGSANSVYWFDLTANGAAIDHPYYQPPDVTAAENLTLRLYAQRTAGTGSLDVDALLLVPADMRGNNPGRTALFTPTDTLSTGDRWVLRPDLEMAHASVPAKPAGFAGSHDFRAVPGENTYIHLLRRTYPGTTQLSGTNIVEWFYRPRWLYVSAP